MFSDIYSTFALFWNLSIITTYLGFALYLDLLILGKDKVKVLWIICMFKAKMWKPTVSEIWFKFPYFLLFREKDRQINR